VKAPAAVCAAVLLIGLQPGIGAAADDSDKESQGPQAPNKLTLAFYHFSSATTGEDVNLRHTFKSTTGWFGVYRQSDGFSQARAGYEYDYHTAWLTIVPSAQAATHGFLGATIYSELGPRFFAIAGMGRTNLQPYWNLGFDPNDYVQLGAGYRDRSGNIVSVYAIHDNRLDTGQTNTHVYFRRYLPGDRRLTVDAVNEHGNGDGGLVVRSWAVSVDVDWSRWFVRAAADPHVNYTPYRQLRIAAGVRF
jgi:hypothetical protein